MSRSPTDPRSVLAAYPSAAPADIDPEIAGVVDRLQARLDALPASQPHRRGFLETYLRTTTAVGQAVTRGAFEDPAWVSHWDVVFAGYFLAAHDADLAGGRAPRPWRLAFGAGPELSDLVHLLVELNAHLNYDLPQAMLAVVSAADFADPALLARRRRDHERIDRVLASRIAAEDAQLTRRPRLRDRLATPLNRWSTQRFLPEARQRVWHNVLELHQARQRGEQEYRSRLTELDALASAKITDLTRPGPVLLRLSVVGFGISLPPR